MADTPTKMPTDQAIAAQKAMLPKLLVPATMGDLEKLLWEYSQKAVPRKDADVTPEEKKVAEEIDKIRELNAQVGRKDEDHNRQYFRAVLEFIERYSVGDQEKQKAEQLASLLHPDEKTRAARFAGEDDLGVRDLAKAMASFKTEATKNGEVTAKTIAEYSKKLYDGVAGFFGVAADAAKGAADTAKSGADKAKDWGQKFLDWLSIGGVTGGIVGLAGASLLGGFFGEGLFGKILTFTLMPLMFIIGNVWGKETIDGWLNKKPEAAGQGREQAKAQGRGQSQAQDQSQSQQRTVEATTGKPEEPVRQVLTAAELNAILSEGKGKVNKNVVRIWNDAANRDLVHVDRVGSKDKRTAGVVPVAAVREMLASCTAAGEEGIVFHPAPGGVKPDCGHTR